MYCRVMKYIGIDVGATFTKAGLVHDGEIIFKTRVPTTSRGEKEFFELVFSVIETVLESTKTELSQIGGIGVGIPGLVNTDKGLILGATSKLGLEGVVDIVKRVQSKYKMPVKIGNDVSMFALAEARKSKTDNLVYIAIGTSFNVGVINNGKLFSGASGLSLEYGHNFIENGLKVEGVISGKAIIAHAKELGIVVDRPDEAFAKSKEIRDRALNYLLIVLLNLINTYRPQSICIGGGYAVLIAPHIADLKRQLKEKSYGYKNAPAVDLYVSDIATDGGILGAAELFVLRS